MTRGDEPSAGDFVFEGVVLRTPLLPVASALAPAPALTPDDWGSDAGYAGACARARARMRRLVEDPAVAEALFLASPTLAERLPVWLAEPDGIKGRRIERALLRYLTRMATRPTPFGLLSGCSAGRFGERTELTLQARSTYRRRSRLDMAYISTLADALNRDPRLRERLTFQPNDTLVRVGDRWRYVDARVGPHGWREYHWVAVEAAAHLERVLAHAAGGRSIDALAAEVVRADAEVALDEASAYIEALIDAQVLVSSLQPVVTGPEPAGELARRLRALGAEAAAAALDTATRALAALDAAGLGRQPSAYVAVGASLAALPAPVELARLVQVDLIKPARLRLGPALRAEIERCAALVARFAPAADPLAGFRKAFVERHGTASVPLLEVLDPESGVGLGEIPSTPDPSPILAGLPLDREPAPDEPTWHPRHTALLALVHDAWRQGRTEHVLEDADLDAVLGPPPSRAPAGALGLGLTLVAQSAEALDRGEFQLVLGGAEGPSGARLLGRFAHADPQIEAVVRDHLRDEEAQAPEALFAEIVHLPEGRQGNIVQRPVLRGCELTYLGRSGAPLEQQLPLSDLRVTVRGETIVLVSARRGRRVIPRLTSAHRFAHPASLPAYRFLALLQAAGRRAAFRWDWGPLEGAPSLPRLRWGRIVLARARWRLTRVETERLGRERGRARFLGARAWAAGRAVPRLFELVEGDQRLLVDLDNPLSVDTFAELVRGRDGATLEELLPGPEQLCVTGPEGAFAHELWVPVIHATTDVAVAVPGGVAPASAAVRRGSAPGGEWLYAQIFAGGSEVDRLLVAVVRPLVSGALRDALAERWFFVRYDRPSSHLRLRLRGDPRVLHGELLPRLQSALAPWLDAGSVSRLALDTYQPEVERYGGPTGLELSERIFQADSEAVLEVLAGLAGDGASDARWQLALVGLEALIDDFGCSPDEKRALVARRRRECALEFGGETTDLKRRLAEGFRRWRPVVTRLLDQGLDGRDPLALGGPIWRARAAKLAPLIPRLRAAEARGELAAGWRDIVDSHLHMYVNRVARAHGRAHELRLFDLLTRAYASQDARARAGRGRAGAAPRSPADTCPAPRGPTAG